MMPIYICEDDASFRKIITEMVKNYIIMQDYDMEIVLTTGSPQKILNQLNENIETGLYFLDIDLCSHINGIGLAEKIRISDPRGFIVFITAHDEYMELTFRYKIEALDYIDKANIHSLKKRIAECIDNVNMKRTAPLNKNVFRFKAATDQIIVLDYDTIIYFETSSDQPHRVTIHTCKANYQYYASLDDIQKQLTADFIRCYRSRIVNIKHIDTFDPKKRSVILRDGTECPCTIKIFRLIKKQLRST